MVVFFAIAPFFSTLLGGFAALRLQHRIHPVMAFAAGLMVATALVELLPEALELLGENGDPLLLGLASVAGYLFFNASEALVHGQTYEHQHPPLTDPAEPHIHELQGTEQPSALGGLFGPAGLIVHSTLDGVLIGLGFIAGQEIGLIVGLAVLAHDFADGLNVVTLALTSGRGRTFAIVLLALDAVATPIGVVLSTLIAFPPEALGVVLAGMAGVFLAIGAGHLLPEAQHRRHGPATALVAMAALGAGLAIVVRIVAE